MSKLEKIIVLIAVIEAEGFTAAARQQGVSTAAISRQIAQLEAELGVQLLQRTTRQIMPTEIGSQYYTECKKLLTELAQVEHAVTHRQQVATGLLTVTSNRYFAKRYLLPRLSEFMAQNPELRVKLELAERFPDLAAEKIDILFGVSVEGTATLVRKRVTTTRYILCAAPDYLEHYGVPRHPSELIQHRYIAHSMRRPSQVITFKGGKTIAVTPILSLNDSGLMRECAIRGLGIVKLHDYIVRDAIQAGQLQPLLTEWQEPQQTVYLYYSAARYLQLKIRRFIDFYIQYGVTSD